MPDSVSHDKTQNVETDACTCPMGAERMDDGAQCEHCYRQEMRVRVADALREKGVVVRDA